MLLWCGAVCVHINESLLLLLLLLLKRFSSRVNLRRAPFASRVDVRVSQQRQHGRPPRLLLAVHNTPHTHCPAWLIGLQDCGVCLLFILPLVY